MYIYTHMHVQYMFVRTVYTDVERCRNLKAMWNPMETPRWVEACGIPLMKPGTPGIYDDL